MKKTLAALFVLMALAAPVSAKDVYVGTEHGKDFWLQEETIVLEEGVYKTDTKDLRNGELDSVTHWKFVTDGRQWYCLRSKNEQLEQTGGSPVNIKRSELAQTIFNYCVNFIKENNP